MSLPESCQEIEATLTEMESCMSLLLPGFDRTDVQTTNRSPPSSQLANACPSADEQPCCSRDLKEDRREGVIQEEEETKERKHEESREGKERKEVEDREGEKRGEEGSSEEEEEGPPDGDVFIRSSGLVSHSYSLDLDLRPGELSHTPTP